MQTCGMRFPRLNLCRQGAAVYGRRGPLAPWHGLIVVLASLLASFQAPSLAQKSETRFSLRWAPDPANPNTFAVEVSGFSTATLQELRSSDWKAAQWQRLLSVYAGRGDLPAAATLPPMVGAYRVESNSLRFVPQFPLEPGVSYRAIFHPDQLPGELGTGSDLIAAVYQAPSRPSTPTTAVTHLYPSDDVLPENLLKFYLHFSAPMSRGHIYDHIHLREDTGKEVELPFLEIDEELWDPSMTRLTLFIDPGRIKRGVRPLEEVGPALQEGKRYTLEIDSAWNDAVGNPLKETFRKTFRIGPPDRNPPDPAHWKIHAPKSETREPLIVAFSEPMDHALAERVIGVADASGQVVTGNAVLGDRERRWTFAPTVLWRRGTYQVAVQTTIEDLAGNNIGKPFEVDLFEGVQQRVTNSAVKLPFEVR